MGAGCFVPRRHRSPRGRAWEALWCPGPAHGGVGALSQRHLARGGVCATRFACPGRFGRRARSSRPCRATGQLPSATLRVCARPVQTPAVRVVHANLGHSASSRVGRRLASPARAPTATALPVPPETCSAGPESRGRHAPPRRAGRTLDAVHLVVGVAATCSPGEAASRLWNGAERARSGGSCWGLPKRVPQAPKDEGDTRPPDELAGPRMQCTSRWVSRQRAARARPQRGRGTAPRGQDLAAHAGEAGVVGRDRGVRGLCSTPGCACSTDCLCLAVGGSCGAVAAADTTPQVLPSVPTTHSALPGARARTAPAGPHAPPTHARAHTPHGQPGRPPGLLHHRRRPPSAALHARDANARPEGTPARTHGVLLAETTERRGRECGAIPLRHLADTKFAASGMQDFPAPTSSFQPRRTWGRGRRCLWTYVAVCRRPGLPPRNPPKTTTSNSDCGP